jgi:hypothetical protein
LLMDRKMETFFERGPHGRPEQLMFTGLILPGFEIGLRHPCVQIVEVTNPVRRVENLHAPQPEVFTGPNATMILCEIESRETKPFGEGTVFVVDGPVIGRIDRLRI